MSHHLVDLRVDPRGVDHTAVIAARLWALGAVGIEERPDRLVVAFADADSARAASAALDGEAPVEVADRTGLDAWRDHAEPVVAGPFVVHPPWVTPPGTGVALSIDPGLAFGSGSHPSTRLALRAIASVVGAGDRVLDVGCGSGVLSVAAALLGATVVATDVDEEALRVTAMNADANGVADQVDAVRPDEVDGRFDAAVVNLTIDLQETVASDVGRRVGAGRAVVVSGVLAGAQEARAVAAYDRGVDRRLVDGEWIGLILR